MSIFKRHPMLAHVLAMALCAGVYIAMHIAFGPSWEDTMPKMTPAQTRAAVEKTREDFELWLTGELAASLGPGEQWPGREHVFRRDPAKPKEYAIMQVQAAWSGWSASLRYEWMKRK